MSFWWWCSIGLIVGAEMKILAGFTDHVAENKTIDPRNGRPRTANQKAAGILGVCIAGAPAWPVFFIIDLAVWMKKK